MTDESLRDRDEHARDRDEASRDRDEVTAQRAATRSARQVQTWATFVLILLVAGLFYTINQRNDAIQDLQTTAIRIERAAINTEEVLLEVTGAQQTPEAQAQAQRVREALDEIATIRRLLCELPELTEMPACNQ